jgi:3',5'-nucleoside bisphosphate phosphatase
MTSIPRFDCHFHTTRSDGLYTPRAALDEAHKQGLTFIACTNHDLIDREMVALARSEGLESIPAFELSVREKLTTTPLSIHVTVYAREFSDRVDQVLAGICAGRRSKVAAQLIKLQKYGFELDYHDFLNYWTSRGLNLDNVGNGHITKYLFPNEPELAGRYKTNERALYELTGQPFEQGFFLRECLKDTGSSPFGAARVAEYEPDLTETARLIQEEGAVCSIAHSHLNYSKLGMSEFTERALSLIDNGQINALEIHASAPLEWVELYQSIRSRTGILLTFGSDCHFETRSDGKHAWLGNLNQHVSPQVLSDEFARFRERVG